VGRFCWWLGHRARRRGDRRRVILVAVYVHRMRAEEAMLVQTFGADYRAYHARSRRLVPWLY